MVRPLFLILFLLSIPPTLSSAQSPSFSLEVLPVLSDRCFHCHGPDPAHREADLRLDVPDSTDSIRGAMSVIAAGDPANSPLWNRISSHAADTIMPPPDSGRLPLSAEERQVLQDWIRQGAEWGRHWSFEPPQKSSALSPDLHPIDAFVHQRLARAGLQPAAAAAPYTVFRRLSLALTGLSPTPEQQQQFLADPSDRAWQTPRASA